MEIDQSTLLTYYKREDIQQAILENAKNKEVAIKFGEKGFGKRPESLQYARDVLEFAKQGATSFHISEERWHNIQRLEPTLKKRELEDLRQGWDLVIDIDCPFLEYSQIAAYLIIEAFKHHGIKSYSVKFSGNHGFHIGIPFEAFPDKVYNLDTKNQFPDGPRRIALYLQEFIKKHLTQKMLQKEDINTIAKKVNKKIKDLVRDNQFDPYLILSIDTVLISPRHLYRSPYSFNEKSGLVSIPIDPDHILGFKKEFAIPQHVKISKFKFLDRTNITKGEANKLIIQAFDYSIKQEEVVKERMTKEFDALTVGISEDYFPPCMKLGLKGLPDGKKRFLFALTNFLSTVNWDYSQIKEKVDEWNKKNPDPLKEVITVSQVRYHQQQKKRILPPNCNNRMYYIDMGICKPDNLCQKIKNPVNYAILKYKFAQRSQEPETKRKRQQKE